MSSEEFEKTAEFILEQQAQSAARIGQLEDLVTKFARATRDRFEITDKRIDDTDEKIAALIDSQMRTQENQRKTEESIRKTDEQLRNLTSVVDRYFSLRRNGN